MIPLGKTHQMHTPTQKHKVSITIINLILIYQKTFQKIDTPFCTCKQAIHFQEYKMGYLYFSIKTNTKEIEVKTR